MEINDCCSVIVRLLFGSAVVREWFDKGYGVEWSLQQCGFFALPHLMVYLAAVRLFAIKN